MIKKITLITILCCMFFSCGKKSDPIYKTFNKKTELKTIFIFKS